jgi:DNA-binding IclR family transcriptional regulator
MEVPAGVTEIGSKAGVTGNRLVTLLMKMEKQGFVAWDRNVGRLRESTEDQKGKSDASA